MTSEQRVLRGLEAERMLADGSVLNQAIEDVRDALTKTALTAKDPAEREEARLAVVYGLGAVVKQLAVYASDGQAEAAKGT